MLSAARTTSTLLLLLALTAGGCLRPVSSLYPPPADDARLIYIVQHNWHAGIVLPRASVPEELWPGPDRFTEARYLEFGWGDAAYYPAEDPGLGLLLRAALWPTPSTLHVAALPASPRRSFPNQPVVAVRLSPEGLARLTAYLRSSYQRNAEGEIVSMGEGLYYRSRFYKARRRYHVFHNCNHWVARALRSAGCPITPAYALTVGLLMRQVRQLGSQMPRPASNN